MSEFVEVVGGHPLSGVVPISGAKNAALPVLIATLLTSERCVIRNVPNLEDVHLTIHLLEHFGAAVTYEGDCVEVSIPRIEATEASYSLVKALRASFWVLGPLLARGGAARVALPGGDIIGARPVDMHIDGLRKMGADIKVKNGVVFATAVSGLRPVELDFRVPSVGATHQIMMAAALTPGRTVIRGAAKEPEIVAVANFLQALGAEIEGAGESTVVIDGKSSLGGTDYQLIGDRIEAGTYLLAGVATRGKVTVEGIQAEYLSALLEILREMGCAVEVGSDWVTVACPERPRAVQVTTQPYPGFPTDLQAPLMAVLATATGESSIEETVFEGRFGNVSELCRMGAEIRVEDGVAHISGTERLAAAPVEGLDIRAAAALVIAALGAEGTSKIHEPQHLRRGY